MLSTQERFKYSSNAGAQLHFGNNDGLLALQHSVSSRSNPPSPFGKTGSLKRASRLWFEGSLLIKGEMVICLGCLPPNKLNVLGNVPRHCSQLAQDCLVHTVKL